MKPQEKVLIIGAGMSGIATAVALQKKGISFEIHEKNSGVGGTWFDNIYPGSGCDIPSFLYSFSFEPNPLWSRKWSTQEEILAYMNHVVDKYNLRDHIHFQSEIASAFFDEATSLWNFTNSSGDFFSARWMICSTGQLNLPNYPNLPGKELFRGDTFHSARWNHSIDLHGKRVAVIGNGASAIQFIPPISKQVNHLTIFQSSPSYIDEKPDYEYSQIAQFLFTKVPGVAWAYRSYLYFSYEMMFYVVQKGLINSAFQKYITLSMKRAVKDSSMQEKVIPTDTLGCKRILISSEYLPAIQQDNVTLVASKVEEITENGVQSQGKEHSVDVIIYSTGFQTLKFTFPIEIIGSKGKRLSEEWKTFPHAYWGITVPNFPNFFLTYGPTTNLGHNSIIFMIECQCEYISKAIQVSQAQNIGAIQIKEENMQNYLSTLSTAAKTSVFTESCNGWYKSKNGQLINNSPLSTIRYWYNVCFSGFSLSDYNILPITSK